MRNRKVVALIKGGLGNQLFCYAAARRLALRQDAELVLDNVSGFTRDHLYQRQYALHRFAITARIATRSERLEPLERLRRRIMRSYYRRLPFEQRRYLEQEGVGFDKRLLEYPVRGTIYLDGYWQSERYFKDIEATVRRDLEVFPPRDEQNQLIAAQICDSNSVCVHVRWFSRAQSLGIQSGHQNLERDYYLRAIARIRDCVQDPKYFIFSDNPKAAVEVLALSEDAVCVDHNHGDDSAYADLWLMTLCSHFIIANSTFSWWGAWLAPSSEKVVIAPGHCSGDPLTWGFDGLLPGAWHAIPWQSQE